MPLPEPNAGETNQEFVDRCMSEANEEFPDREQRFAVCNAQLEKRNQAIIEALKQYMERLKKIK